jgi:hypothetical protein
MYRTGSRIRVRISAPNGDQPIWSFGETVPAAPSRVAIGYGPGMPSSLVLPVVPGAAAPTALPPCPGLRGEPCRDYQPFQNATVTLADTAGGPQAPASDRAPQAPKKCTAKKHKRSKQKAGCGGKKKRGKKK